MSIFSLFSISDLQKFWKIYMKTENIAQPKVFRLPAFVYQECIEDYIDIGLLTLLTIV